MDALMAAPFAKDEPVVVAKWTPATDKPLVKAVAGDGGWRFDFDKAGDYDLFDVPVTPPGPGKYVCKLEIKSANVEGTCQLYVWHFHQGLPGRFWFGSTGGKIPDWSSRQGSCVFLKTKEQPEKFRLSIRMEKTGTVWIRDVQFLHEKVTTPQQKFEIAAADTIQVEPKGMKVLYGLAAWGDLSPDGKTLALVGPLQKLRWWHAKSDQWQLGESLYCLATSFPRFSPDGS